MTEGDYKRTLAKKLSYYMSTQGKNQMDLMRDLHLSSSTVSSWCTGQKMPRMNKLEMLANYFGVNATDLITDNHIEFKDVLYVLRTERGLSQRDLAEKLHKSTGTIGMWENGTRLPSREAQEQIADFFNVTLDFLSGRDSESVYRLDTKTAELAQEIFENKELHELMDAARDLKPENIQFFTKMIKKFKEVNPDG